jgi:hypothetical protein
MTSTSTNSGKQLPQALGYANLILLHALLLGGGSVLIVWSIQAYRMLEQAQVWPATQAKVTESRVVYYHNNYRPVVRYEYTFEGVRYLGRTWRLGYDRTDSRDEAERAIATFPLDSRPTVFVNPADPNQSVLDREHLNGNVKQLLGGIGVLGMGLIIPACALGSLLRGRNPRVG